MGVVSRGKPVFGALAAVFLFLFFNPDLSRRGEEWRNESGNPESEGGRLKERVNRQENSVEKCGGV